MSNPKIKYQFFRFTIAAAGDEVAIDGATDKLYKFVTGINYDVSDANAGFSQVSLEIGGEEITPDGFELRRFAFNPYVPADYQFKTILVPAAGNTLRGRIKDVDPTGSTNYPYTFVIAIRMENELPQQK